MTLTLEALTPYLKYPGGKRGFVERVSSLYDRTSRFVELFCGSASMSLGLRPDRVLLCDRNPYLINLHQQVQRGLDMGAYGVEWVHDEATYYRQRDRFNELIRGDRANTPEAACLLLYLNRSCYNGLMRFNLSGLFNVPFGKYKTVNYSNVALYAEAFKGWEMRQGDFERMFYGEVKPDDFLYCDPPYDCEFTQYGGNVFTWKDQVRLANLLAQHPGKVVLHNAATDRILELYEYLGFSIEIIEVRRSISCKKREAAREIFAVKEAGMRLRKSA